MKKGNGFEYAGYVMLVILLTVVGVGLWLLGSNFFAHAMQSASEGDIGSAWLYTALAGLFR